MGYTTEYRGELKFTRELVAKEIAFLQNEVLGEDIRDHKSWILPKEHYCYHLDFDLTRLLDGLKHNGAEKSNDAANQLNIIMGLLNAFGKQYGLPFISITGSLLAQGEEVGDVYYVTALGDHARYEPGEELAVFAENTPIDLQPSATDVVCPHCSERFAVRGNEAHDVPANA